MALFPPQMRPISARRQTIWLLYCFRLPKAHRYLVSTGLFYTRSCVASKYPKVLYAKKCRNITVNMLCFRGTFEERLFSCLAMFVWKDAQNAWTDLCDVGEVPPRTLQ